MREWSQRDELSELLSRCCCMPLIFFTTGELTCTLIISELYLGSLK